MRISFRKEKDVFKKVIEVGPDEYTPDSPAAVGVSPTVLPS